MNEDLPVLIKPLEVELNGVGQYQHAETVQDLVKMLMGGKWPGGGRKYHNALWRSMEAIDWYIDASTARAAFVDAAHEAGMHVLPDDMAQTVILGDNALKDRTLAKA
ncbi:DUF982 domain-containing protein [Rhizobium mesoamericanum]|uniref:DUF982 domain-containing protein n=1 Tax=Rhizobium mesoamericanum STM3625 TaxID=1211777 RepID=K0PXN4_9HYPH|nr:DUF982 domain-containing protein [Rhizobium mesoamericanum]CCM76455.1 hypothetical protein BN77_3468 [Rhizobium mesoamericanum STM3625]